MSKKTEADKRKRATKPRRHTRKRRERRPNPARGTTLPPHSFAPLGDPIFMYHVLGAMSRLFELRIPSGLGDSTEKTFSVPNKIDAEFADDPAEPSKCVHCGRTKGPAWEENMGFYCEKSETGIHVWKTKEEPTQ